MLYFVYIPTHVVFIRIANIYNTHKTQIFLNAVFNTKFCHDANFTVLEGVNEKINKRFNKKGQFFAFNLILYILIILGEYSVTFIYYLADTTWHHNTALTYHGELHAVLQALCALPSYWPYTHRQPHRGNIPPPPTPPPPHTPGEFRVRRFERP